MDQILNIDNNETKKVGISTESGGITGSIDFLSDNNSDKSNNSPFLHDIMYYKSFHDMLRTRRKI